MTTIYTPGDLVSAVLAYIAEDQNDIEEDFIARATRDRKPAADDDTPAE